MDYDLIIVGAGPAGSTLAASLPESVRVLLVDKRIQSDASRRYEREKSCGGMLDKRAQKALAAQKIALPKELLVSPQVFTLRGIDLDNKGAERYYQRQYVNIDRVAFDAFLAGRAAAKPNVTFLEDSTVFDFTDDGESVTAHLRTPDGSRSVTAGYLVGADGATSVIRRKLTERGCIKPRFKSYASVQEWHPVDAVPASYVAVFDRRVTDFYSWIIPEEGRVIIGSALPAEKSANRRFEQFKQDLTELGWDLSRPIKRRGAVILRPRGIGGVSDGSGRVFLIGEAAGLISPSSCEGISFALDSGYALAQAFGASKGTEENGEKKFRKRYRSGLKPLKRSIFGKSFKSPIMYGRLWRGLVFKSGALSMKVNQ